MSDVVIGQPAEHRFYLALELIEADLMRRDDDAAGLVATAGFDDDPGPCCQLVAVRVEVVGPP